MKKYLFIAAAALTMMAGCNKYKVEVGNPTNPTDDNSPVEIQVAARTAGVDVKTKAAVDAWTGNEKVTILGYSGEGLIFQSDAAVPAGEGTVTFEDPDLGTKYYEDGEIYDFYGAYLGGVEPTAETVENGTAYSDGFVEITIDGSQDVMLAKADKYADGNSLPAEMIENFVYGAQAARRGIQPSMEFQHMLTRFVVDVKTDASTTDLYLNAVAVASGTKMKLNVKEQKVQDNTNATEGSSDYIFGFGTSLSEANASAVILDGDGLDTKADLMVFPGKEEYTFTIYLSQSTNVFPKEITISTDAIAEAVNKTETFEAGKKYVVTFTVYGATDIAVTVSVADWDEVTLNDYDDNVLTSTYTLIDEKTLTVETGNDGHTIKSYEDADGNKVTSAQNDVYYTTKGSIITVGENNTVTFTKAQELKVTLAGESVKAYHYVETAALPVKTTGETPGDVIYVTGEPHYGTFTLVYDEQTYTVVTGEDFVVASIDAYTEPVEPTPTVVELVNGTELSYTFANETYTLTSDKAVGTYFSVDGETVTAWVIATDGEDKTLTVSDGAKVDVSYEVSGENKNATIYYAAANLAAVVDGGTSVAAYTSATDIPAEGVAVIENEVTYNVAYNSESETLTATTGN